MLIQTIQLHEDLISLRDFFFIVLFFSFVSRDTFREMEKRRQMSDEIDSVRGLEAWEPAKPIHQALIPEDPPAKK